MEMIFIKSYKNLWNNIISDENIRLAIYNASHGNMKRKVLENMKRDPDKYIETVRRWIENFEPSEHTPKVINDGISAKKREIIVPTVCEHIVQHALMNVLRPILSKGMYEHSYASIPGRGCHKGMRTVRKWIAKDGRNCKYCLKIDIKKFFQSVDTGILQAMLFRKITDRKTAELISKILSTSEKGLPLGFYTSQWFANFYLQEFDYFVKEKLKVKHYIRYMDDMVFFGPNKRKLHEIKAEIEKYLKYNLELSIKENWQIFRFHTRKDKGRFLDFMGFKFYRNRVTIRKKITLKAMRKARRIAAKKNPTVHDARQMLTYIGWTKCTDTYMWLKRHILSRVDFKKLRKIISEHDRRNYNGILQVQEQQKAICC